MCSTTPQCIEKRQQTIEPQRARLNKGEGQVHQAGAPQSTSSGSRARLQLVVWLFHSELTTGATHLPTICWTDQPKTAYYGKSKATQHSSRGSFYVAKQNTPTFYLPVSSTHYWVAMIVLVYAPFRLWSCMIAFKIKKLEQINPYMQKAGDTWDISPQIFLDFPQNFRLRTRNVHDLRTFSTILDGGSTILDGSSTIFCRISQFHKFLYVVFNHLTSKTFQSSTPSP